MTRRVMILLGVPVLVAGLLAVPLGLWRGPYQWLCAGVAVGLTVPPGLVTLWATERFARSSPYGRVVGAFVGTFVRLAVGFGGGAVVFFAAGDTFRDDFVSYWAWVLGMYLTTLVVETALLAGPLLKGERPA